MKSRAFKSIRAKLIVIIAAASVIALASTQALYRIAELNYRKPFFNEILSLFSHNIGVQATVYLTGALSFVALLFFLTRRSIKYLEEISAAIHGIENGNLDLRVEVRTDDEFGDLAASINKMAEKLKTSIEEERKAEAAKKDLITSVSHDLRTPLTSVIGFLGILTNRGGHNDEELERYASIAHKKALKLQELIDELFEYTRVSYSSLKANISPIDLAGLIEQLVDEFYPLLEENGMEVRLSASLKKLQINADGDLIARLFENLVNNAIRYGKEGKYIDINVYEEGSSAVVEIANYGEIIPQKHLDRIFEKFYRADPSRSRETGGTGLGLAIAHSIVQIHSGTITAMSGEKGTCFKVSLPVSNKEGSIT